MWHYVIALEENIVYKENNIDEDVEKTLGQMRTFSNEVRHGHWKGYSGKRITDAISIGFGALT